MRITFGVFMKRSPRTQITPSKRSRKYINFICFFHYCIVYRNIFTCREEFIHHLLFLVCIIIREQAFEHPCHGRLIYPDGIDNGIDIPYKDSCIPEIVAALQIAFCRSQIRFFTERIYPINFLIGRTRHRQVCFNIAVTCFRTIGFHTQCDNSIRVGRKLHSRCDNTTKLTYVHYHMVTRCHHDIGFRITCLDFPAHIRNTRRCVTAARLQQNMINRNLRELFFYNLRIFGRGYHPYIFRQAHIFKTIDGQLNERTSATQHINKLLGHLRAAHRPKATAYASGHNDHMVIHWIHNKLFLVTSQS